MRIALWLLLALNGLAAAIWLAGFSLPPKPVAALTAPTPSAKPLQLLSELPALPPRLDTLPVDGGEPSSALDEVVGPPVAQTPVEASAVAQEPAASAAEPVVDSPAPTPAAVTPPARVAEPAPALAKAKPAAPVEPPPATETPTVPDAAAAAATPEGSACYRTAALAGDAFKAAGVALRAADLGELKSQSQGSPVRPRYWVYWAGEPGALTDIEARLKAADVRDWYRNGNTRISLGVYSRADSARQRQRELSAKGIQTQIGESFPPQAKLRWVLTAQTTAVDAAKAGLEHRGVRLENCP